MTHPSTSWADAERSFAQREHIPEALKSLAVLLSVGRKWQNAVEVRTSMFDLIFTMPEVPYPFARSVTVRWEGGGTLQLEKKGFPEHSQKVTLEDAPAVVDRALKWLVDGTLWCARCGGQVVAGANHYTTFENMHWVCFHYEFEHGMAGADADKGCGHAGCPAGLIEGVPVDEALVLADLLTDLAERGPDAYVPDDRATRVSVNAVLWRLTSRLGKASAPGRAERVAQARERLNRAGT